MKTCIIYANCQGVDGIIQFMYKVIQNSVQNTTIKCISVHEFVNTDKELDTELVKRAPIYFYINP